MLKCPYCDLPLEKAVATCPSCYADLGGADMTPQGGHRSGETLIERPADAERDKHDQRRGEKPKSPKSKSTDRPQATTSKSLNDKDQAVPFYPQNCPPMLKLCHLDPGSRDEGEWYRIYDRRFVIGRAEGDLTLPWDEGLSGMHAELIRRTHGNGYRFVLVDLNSTNGTFVRVSRVVLRPGQELLIGSHRFSFDAGESANATTPDQEDHDDDMPTATISWQNQGAAVAPTKLMSPGLTERTPGGEPGRKLVFSKSTHWIGSDPKRADFLLSGDPFVSSVHARITKTDQGGWRIDNANSLNGIWLRVSEMPLEKNAEFQISEQRFLVRPVSPASP